MSIVSHFAGSAMQNTPKSDDLGNDLVIGMRAIAEFWGMPERKAYYMASKGLLPGVSSLASNGQAANPSPATLFAAERRAG